MKFIIDFKNNASAEEIENYLVSNAITVVKQYNKFDKLFLTESSQTPPNDILVESITADDASSMQLLDTITILSDQLYGKKDPAVQLMTVINNTQNWWKSYSIKNAELDSTSFSINRRGNNSTVYVLDSGVEISHQEFANQNVVNFYSFNNDFADKKGHGTAIASIIVGQTIGVTNCTVKSVKIFDPDTVTLQSDLLTALDNIFNDVVTNQIEYPIVNCSWIIAKNNLIENKIRTMIENGVFFIAAAGNNGGAIENVTPASMPEVITVGAYDDTLTPCNFSAYSGSIITFTAAETNYGQLDVWAPGAQIYAAALNNNYGYAYGTSIAAAIQTAALAYNFSFSEVAWRLGNSYSDFAKNWCASRKDMLNLSDSKYATSANLITTILDQVPQKETITYNWLIKTKSNQYVWRNLFVPSVVAKLELFAALPAEYNITNSGKFYGKSPQITDDFTINIIPIKLTLVDNSVIETDLEIINIRDDYTGQVGDPILNAKLQFAYNCLGGPLCFNQGIGDTCVDDCYNTGEVCATAYPALKECGNYDDTWCDCIIFPG